MEGNLVIRVERTAGKLEKLEKPEQVGRGRECREAAEAKAPSMV
jgi:hypothetical protein